MVRGFVSGLARKALDEMKVNVLDSIKDNVSEQFSESLNDELLQTKIWLEGWVCGITDPITGFSSLREKGLTIVQTEFNKRINELNHESNITSKQLQ